MRRHRWADWVEPAHEDGELELVPAFGVRAWTAASTCEDVHPHGARDEKGRLLMPPGTNFCCMACHRSGRERHPALRETVRDRLRVARWEPPEGGDQWSVPTAEPTSYAPATAAARLSRSAWRDIYYGRAEPPPGLELDPMNRGYLRPIDPGRIARPAS